MKTIAKLLFVLLALVGMITPNVAVASKADVDKYLMTGGKFRIKNRGSGRYMTENPTTNAMTGVARISAKPNTLQQVWLVEGAAGTYTIRNAYSGRFIPAESGNPMKTTIGANTIYMKYSAANSGTSTSYVSISWDINYGGNKSLNENNGTHNILGWMANSSTVNDNFSDWVLEPVEDITTDDVKNQINKTSNVATATDGGYVRIISTAYNVTMSESSGTNTLNCINIKDNDFSQIWQLNKTSNDKWTLKNVLSDRYVQRQNGSLSTTYKTTPSNSNTFGLNDGGDAYLTTYTFEDNNRIGLHCDQARNVVGWYTDAGASKWILKKVELDTEALKKAKDEIATYSILTTTNITKIRTTLKHYFEDQACTQLKEQYQNMSDDELVKKMSEDTITDEIKIALPTFIQDIVLKVKNGTWSHREKEFRIYDYKAYSDHTQWNAINKVGTGHKLSPQTGPTGISVKRGDIVQVFVGSSVPTGTSLEMMLCERMNITGTTTRLTPGYNVVRADKDGHLFVCYVIRNTTKKPADVPAIPIHIEGGYVNGYFDITRGHTNEDWLDMEKTLFKDEIIHLKNKWTQFNMILSGVKSHLNYSQMKQTDTDGTPKGIQGVLIRWDEFVELERELIGAPQFYDYFNCCLSASASSGGNPYATDHGTFYPGVGTYMNYDHMTFGTENDEGGDFWMVAHEVGHTNQALINLPGDTEMSVNFFSQVCRWFQGSNVGRGRPLSNTIGSFHKGQHYSEYDIWQRSRMYFQLWLYYVKMGHDPEFYHKLCDAMRKNPMKMSHDENTPMSAQHSYFHFAKLCCDAAQEDLSEFFQFYGFFKDVKKVTDYSNSYFKTPKTDVDAALAYMRKYEKKAHPGLIFIDERIRKYPANFPGMKKGATRLATSDDATPGDAKEVGDVGMFDDFRDDLETAPYTCTVSNSGAVVVKKDGKGAVGFKVYDAKHNLVFVSNTHRFTIPADIRQDGYYIVVAYGNGKQQTLHDTAGVTAIDNVNADAPTENGKVYDLNGHRTDRRAKGVKIVNGKVKVQ